MSKSNSPVVLVASDPHGRIPLLLGLALRFQREFSRPVGQILVCGDMGIFPDDRRLDAATRRFARRFPEELGFRVFEPLVKCRCEQPPPRLLKHLRLASRVVAAALEELPAPVYFVGGNHEDYGYLARCQRLAEAEGPVPVEASGRLRWLGWSSRSILATCVGDLDVVGFSGIDAAGAHRNPSKLADGAMRDDDDVLELLVDDGARGVDLLLTHDGASGLRPRWGSHAIAEAIRTLDPTFHFWGHEHEVRAPVNYAEASGFGDSRTSGVLVNKLDSTPGRLEPQCLGVLSRGQGGALEFEFAPSRWLAQTTAESWAHA